MVSLVLRATPPRDSPAGEGRMIAFGSLDKDSMRVLSPRILPFVIELLGSTASTATLYPLEVKRVPKLSIKVLLPTPGTPVIPIRMDGLFAAKQLCRISFARF